MVEDLWGKVVRHVASTRKDARWLQQPHGEAHAVVGGGLLAWARPAPPTPGASPPAHPRGGAGARTVQPSYSSTSAHGNPEVTGVYYFTPLRCGVTCRSGGNLQHGYYRIKHRN